MMAVLRLLLLSSETSLVMFSHSPLGPLAAVMGVGLFLALMFAVYLKLKPSNCYLIDFCCTKLDDQHMVNTERFEHFVRKWRDVKQSNLLFQLKVYLRAGLGEETYAPPRLLEKGQEVNLGDAREETEGLIFSAVQQLLSKTKVEPKKVDVVILNSSIFNPVPSLTTYLVNSFKMRSSVKSFNLSGMGCSAGLIAVDLAKDLLQVHPNAYALVVSTENITQNMYFGNDRSMMVSNCLFRCGTCAILLTNKASEKSRAKLELVHCLRTHQGADEESFQSVTHREDEAGVLGVSLQPSLMEAAGKALRANITRLAPLILPSRELLKIAINMLGRNVLRMGWKPYQPRFEHPVNHFCIHPGGRAVIDAISNGLKLSEVDSEPGRMALHRFGNTSSSGIWYALAYCEAKDRLKRGNIVWQIALGSGFKCNSGVWRVLKDIHHSSLADSNPWVECIHRYPVVVTTKITVNHPYAWVLNKESTFERKSRSSPTEAVACSKASEESDSESR